MVAIIKSVVDSLPESAHSLGLRSVLRHIDAAIAHLVRGQESLDDGAFTDAIYRTNQAFEGSVKEAYRVLANKDPAKLSPATIESYLEKGKFLRERVLIQLRRYRQEWRNPSTHDYNLDFDEDEAFLAIVSVSAFAKVLIDQIAQSLAFAEAAAVAEPVAAAAEAQLSVPSAVLAAIQSISSRDISSPSAQRMEVQIVGALAGHLSKIEAFEISLEPGVTEGGRVLRPDMLIRYQGEEWVVELKPNRRRTAARSYAMSQVLTYMSAAKTDNGILLLYEPGAAEYRIEQAIQGGGTALTIIAPDFLEPPDVVTLQPD